MYCVYLTTYHGNKLPPFYIGYTSLERIANGYHGSVSSVKYKNIWINEIKSNPQLFTSRILKTFNTKQEAKSHETYLQRKFKVHKNPMYINMHIQGTTFYGSTNNTKGKTLEQVYGLDRAREIKAKMSFSNVKMYKDIGFFTEKSHTPEAKIKIGLAKKGIVKSDETRKKLSISQTGKKHKPETIEKLKQYQHVHNPRRNAVSCVDLTGQCMLISTEIFWAQTGRIEEREFVGVTSKEAKRRRSLV